MYDRVHTHLCTPHLSFCCFRVPPVVNALLALFFFVTADIGIGREKVPAFVLSLGCDTKPWQRLDKDPLRSTRLQDLLQFFSDIQEHPATRHSSPRTRLHGNASALFFPVHRQRKGKTRAVQQSRTGCFCIISRSVLHGSVSWCSCLALQFCRP